MAQTSFALLTNIGRQKEAAALGNGTALVVTHIAIGDGATVPSGGETQLYHEVLRKTISGQGVVAGATNVAYADIFLAADEGPFTIREAGLFDSAGDMIAIARYDPPVNKPVPGSGQTVEGIVRIEVAFSNTANVTIVVDPAISVALQRLSVLPWIPVISKTATVPPASPAIGATYLVPNGATGIWSGHSGKIAEFTSAGWALIVPRDGHGIGLPDGRVFIRTAGIYSELGDPLFRLRVGDADIPVNGWQPAPPGSPAVGDRYVVAAGATGSWTGQVNNIATWTGTAWVFAAPVNGLQVNYNSANTFAAIWWNGLIWQALSTRRRLSGDATLWVRADGNDANDGSANTAAKAFATLQGAWNYAATSLDLSGYLLSIRLGAPGVYASVLLSNLGLQGQIRILGDAAAPQGYIISQSQSQGWCIASDIGTVFVDGVTLDATYVGAGNLLFARTSNAQISIGAVRFTVANANPSLSLISASGGGISPTGKPITITGGGSFGVVISTSGAGVFTSFTGVTTVFTITNVSWAAFTSATLGSLQSWSNVSFAVSGISGSRYAISTGGTIVVQGGSLATFFPGTTAGTNSTTLGDTNDPASVLAVLANLGLIGSQAGNGWMQIKTSAGSFVLNWGTADTDGSGQVTPVFPQALSAEPYFYGASVKITPAAGQAFLVAANPAGSASTMTITVKRFAAGALDTPAVPVCWWAFGKVVS